VRVMANLSQGEPGQAPENGYQMSVPTIPGITDSELIVYVVREAQLVLSQHIERSPRDAEETITSLLEILDRRDVVAATERLCREYGLRPLK
jgi:hypothetical protein